MGLKSKKKYIDIGCYHPLLNSVTYTLYKRGWCGIVFDPQKESKALFQKYRNRDIFINAAVGEKDGIDVNFYFFKKREFSMSSSKYLNHNIDRYNLGKVKQVNLSKELERNSIKNFDIINVDVEGGEYEILKGIDFKKYTPSIIIVEIKADNIHEGINHKISELLLKHGYELHAVCVISYFFVKIKNYLN